ncbi:hypothetical protein ABQF34_05790 [Mycolicibacterium boenickei]
MSTDETRRTEPPPITDEHREEAKRVMESYDEDRPTITLPGSGNTISGTAINDWVDDDGKPIYGQSKDDG